MSETKLHCCWSDGVLIDLDCDRPATFLLRLDCLDGKERVLTACDAHLADIAHGTDYAYPHKGVALEELPSMTPPQESGRR